MEELKCQNKSKLEEQIALRGIILRTELSKLGLYIGQPVMLEIVSSHPGLTQKQLSVLAGIKPSTVNVMLGRMAKNELVEIKKDKENLKLSRVYITQKGNELAEKGINLKLKLDEIAYTNLTSEEIKNFEAILSKMNDNLKKEFIKEEIGKDVEIFERKY